MGRAKRIWYLSPMRAAKVQASLRIRAVSPEPPLLAHTSSESRGPFRQKARSLAPLNGWACAVNICHGGMLVDTNSLDAAQMISFNVISVIPSCYFSCILGSLIIRNIYTTTVYLISLSKCESASKHYSTCSQNLIQLPIGRKVLRKKSLFGTEHLSIYIVYQRQQL